MKTLLMMAAAALLLVGVSWSVAIAQGTKGKSKLRHVVAFKFKDSTSPAEVRRVEEAFAALKGKISQIEAFEWGMNNSPEGLNKGCTHGFILTFGSEKDRDAYLIHPDHQEFGKIVKPVLADVFVVDFWTKE